jgi:hypothetical protein
MTSPSRALRAASLAAALFCAAPAQAAFHLWHVKEVYSNADGSIQYVELFTGAPTESVVSGHTLKATSDGVERIFTADRDLAGSTEDRHLLFATPGFAELPGALAPDFVLACGPFFDPGAGSITIDWAGVDTLVFSGSALPTDGATSLTDTTPTSAPTLMSGTNSPTNFAGTVGQLALSDCLADGSCDACEDGVFCNGAETCVANQCQSSGTPCDSETQTCIEDEAVCVPEAGAAASGIAAWLALAGGAAARRHASSARPG